MARTTSALESLETEESDHFVFYYARRSQWTPLIQPKNKPPIRFHGVHSIDHVSKFKAAFEESWKYYAQNGWYSIQKRIADKIPVFFLYMPGIDGRTWARPLGIDVASCHGDVYGPTNKVRVEATAAHELFHVLQVVIRPKCFDDSDAWAWFSEATAAFMESQVFPKNHEYFCYLYRWFDEPELPLEIGPNGYREYGSLMFCRFLHDRFPRDDILRHVWMSANNIQNPIEALCAYLENDVKVPLASPLRIDLFANEFLVWNFFLGARRCGYREKMLLKEKFQHTFTGPIMKAPSGQDYVVNFGELGPLAGRYHLIEIPKEIRPCRIKVELSSADSIASPGKAIVHAISSEGQLIYRQKQVTVDGADGNFSGHFDVPSAWLKGTVRLILLIVANVSYGHNQAFIDNYKLTLQF